MKKILVVDDDPHHLLLLKLRLSNSGYEVITAKSAKEAMEKLEEVSPDLIIADILMPEIDGFKFCKMTREKEKYKDLPFIFLSALGDTESKIKGLGLGADEYMTKPFSYKELLTRVKILLDRYARYKDTIKDNAIIKGKLEEVSISDLSQLLYYGKKTVKISITGKNRADIWMKEGKIINAAYKNKKGMDALFHIFKFKEGDFQVIPLKTCDEEEVIKTSTEEIILELMRQIDEANKMREEWGDESLIKAANLIGTEEEVTNILYKNVTLKELLESSPFSEYKTLYILEKLEKDGKIKIERKAPPPTKVFDLLIFATNRYERNLFLKNVAEGVSESEGVWDFAKLRINNQLVNLYGIPGAKMFASLWEVFIKKSNGIITLVNPEDKNALEDAVFAITFIREKSKVPIILVNTNPTFPLPPLPPEIGEDIKKEVCSLSDKEKVSSIIRALIKA